MNEQLEPLPPLPSTHPPAPFGSGAPRGSPMKFTTFHQHNQLQQLVAHPQQTPTNGNFNGNNYQTQTIHVTNQQHYVMPQQPQSHHHHQQQQLQQQQQFYDNNPQYVSNSNFSKMSAPLATQQQQQQQQRSSAIWHQQYTNTTPSKNDFNGNGTNESG